MNYIRYLILILLLSFSVQLYASHEVIYGISPVYMARGTDKKPFPEITRRLPEIKKLGVTILWLQPIYKSAAGGQGYDTVAYKKVDPRLGTDKELRELIEKAHSLGLKVIFDIAINHTSIEHRFAKDFSKNGSESKYKDFYQTKISKDTPYSEHQKERESGLATFVRYFWPDFVNINYSNKNAQQFAIDVTSYWIKNFDIDGYRFDASWGPSSRWPSFYNFISTHLKKIKSNIFLLAEDKSAYPENYKNTDHPHFKGSHIDAAYDWDSSDPYWLSRWSFQLDEESHQKTVFNSSDSKIAADHFYKAVRQTMRTNSVTSVRYIENNDTGSFLISHTPEQTMWAAKTLYFLPGIPMLFYGQAEGIKYAQWELPTLEPDKTLREHDVKSWDFYKALIHTRKKYGPLKISKLQLKGSVVTVFYKTSKVKLVVDFSKQISTIKKL